MISDAPIGVMPGATQEVKEMLITRACCSTAVSIARAKETKEPESPVVCFNAMISTPGAMPENVSSCEG